MRSVLCGRLILLGWLRRRARWAAFCFVGSVKLHNTGGFCSVYWCTTCRGMPCSAVDPVFICASTLPCAGTTTNRRLLSDGSSGGSAFPGSLVPVLVQPPPITDTVAPSITDTAVATNTSPAADAASLSPAANDAGSTSAADDASSTNVGAIVGGVVGGVAGACSDGLCAVVWAWLQAERSAECMRGPLAAAL